MPKFTVHKNNEVYPDSSVDHYLEVTDGEFSGLHFNMGRIEFLGEDEEGNGKIEFDYNLLLVPAGVNIEERKQDVEELISQVLHAILEQMVENSKKEVTDETGNVDTQQSAE